MGGRLVGLITLDDIIRLLARELGEIARIIGKESPKILIPLTFFLPGGFRYPTFFL